MDNALARLLGQEPLESLDGPGKEHMIDEILNVLSHAEDEGSSSSQENTPQHTTQHAAQPIITKQTLPSLSTILATTGIGKKDSPPGLNTIAATATTTLGYQAPYPTPAVTTGNIGNLAFKATTNPLVMPPYQTVTVRTSGEGDEDGEVEGDEVDSPLSSEEEDDSPSPGATPVKLPSFPTLTSSGALRHSDSPRSSYLSVAQLTRDSLPTSHEYLRAALPSAHTLHQFMSQRPVANFPDAREVLAAKAEPIAENQTTYEQATFIETTTPEPSSVNRYQSVRDHISTAIRSDSKPPKYSTYESSINRAAAVVANTPTKSALHATLQGDYQPANNSADTSAEEETYRSYNRTAEPEQNVKTLPTRPAAPLDYLAAAAARYEYQHYPKGIALAKSSQSTDYKVALTTSPSSYRHTLPQTVQAAGLMSSAEFAYKAQLEQEIGDVVIGSYNLGTTKDKYAGIPHDELALKTEVYGDRTIYEKQYTTESTHAQLTLPTTDHIQTTLPSTEYLLSSRDPDSAAIQISQIQAALSSHTQHAETQAALAKMHSEIVKTATTSAGNSLTVSGRQFVTGTVSESMPLQQAPPVTTAASHLEIMKLPKKRGRPPKGPDDFSPPPPVVSTQASPAATSVSSIHHRPLPLSATPKYDRPAPTRSPQVTSPPAHGETSPGEQVCMNCGQYFSSSLMFEKHVTSRTCERYKGPYNCPKCTKQFTRRFNLQLHLQKGCAKKKRNSYWPANKEEFEEYATREQIQQKVQLNQGKRKSGIWHKCGKCGQAFTDAQVYNSHIAVCLAGKKLFKCKYCPKQFSRRSGNLQIHMLTCPGKAAFEAAGGIDTGSPPLLPDYDGSSYSRPHDQWPSIRSDSQIPRKKQRRPKAPKIASQNSVRPPLDMSIHAAGHEQFYSKMQLETPSQLPPPLPHSSLPPYQVPSEVREQKLLQQEILQGQTSDLQQIILQREQELIKQERLLLQQEEEPRIEEQVAQDMPHQQEIVPPPLAVLGSVVVPQDDILTENSVSDVAANVAISTEPSSVEIPKKRSRPLKGRTPSVDVKFVSTSSNDNVSFTPEPQIVLPEPVKIEEKPKSSNRKRKVSSESAQIPIRTPVSRRERTKSRTEEEQAVPLPMETPGSKINYATTSITTENVIPHKRIKKRPNYAQMNDDADDANSKGRKTDVNAIPEVTTPRIKRSRIKEEHEEKELEEEDDDDDDDEFAPKHISKKAARLKQESSEPDYVAISGGTSYRCKCGKVCRRQADITRHLEFCKFGSKVEKPYACACGLRYVNQVSVRRHQQLTKCIGYNMGAKGTSTTTKSETSPAPSDTSVKKGDRHSGKKTVLSEQVLTDSASQEGSDSSFSAGVESSHATPGSSSETTTSDAATLQDSPVKMAEHRKHYRCSTCHRKFVNRKTYQRHKTIYCNNQTHECPTCKETFTSATVLGFHQMEHQEELPFGCSICGSKFKSASTLSRHRESHAQIKKPIKKLKIKIIDGSCVISKVDSPAGAQRDRESRDNSPAMTQGKAGNQVVSGEVQPSLAASSGHVSNNSVIDATHGQNEGKGETGETYMVEISTVEDNILVPDESDVIDDTGLVPHPSHIIAESTMPEQSDVIEETVVGTGGPLMISSEGVTFSENTNNGQPLQGPEDYLVPEGETTAWPADSLANDEEIPHGYVIPGDVLSAEIKVERSVSMKQHGEAPPMGTAVITEKVTDSAASITQFSDLAAVEAIHKTEAMREEMSMVEGTPVVGSDTNLGRSLSVIEIAPSAVKIGEDTLKVGEATIAEEVKYENDTEQIAVQATSKTYQNGEVDAPHAESIARTTQ